VAIAASVTSSAAANVLVDIEVYSPSGAKVFQRAFDNQAFTAGQKRTYSVSWRVPGTAQRGTYVVKLGIFGPGWSGLRSWNDSAVRFTVR
jgi:hypothetical protein